MASRERENQAKAARLSRCVETIQNELREQPRLPAADKALLTGTIQYFQERIDALKGEPVEV